MLFSELAVFVVDGEKECFVGVLGEDAVVAVCGVVSLLELRLGLFETFNSPSSNACACQMSMSISLPIDHESAAAASSIQRCMAHPPMWRLAIEIPMIDATSRIARSVLGSMSLLCKLSIFIIVGDARSSHSTPVSRLD